MREFLQKYDVVFMVFWLVCGFSIIRLVCNI